MNSSASDEIAPPCRADADRAGCRALPLRVVGQPQSGKRVRRAGARKRWAAPAKWQGTAGAKGARNALPARTRLSRWPEAMATVRTSMTMGRLAPRTRLLRQQGTSAAAFERCRGMAAMRTPRRRLVLDTTPGGSGEETLRNQMSTRTQHHVISERSIDAPGRTSPYAGAEGFC